MGSEEDVFFFSFFSLDSVLFFVLFGISCIEYPSQCLYSILSLSSILYITYYYILHTTTILHTTLNPRRSCPVVGPTYLPSGRGPWVFAWTEDLTTRELRTVDYSISVLQDSIILFSYSILFPLFFSFFLSFAYIPHATYHIQYHMSTRRNDSNEEKKEPLSSDSLRLPDLPAAEHLVVVRIASCICILYTCSCRCHEMLTNYMMLRIL
jgi:hypothetical protein